MTLAAFQTLTTELSKTGLLKILVEDSVLLQAASSEKKNYFRYYRYLGNNKFQFFSFIWQAYSYLLLHDRHHIHVYHLQLVKCFNP